MKHGIFQMVIDIRTKSGGVLKPHEIHFWDFATQNNPKHLHNFLPNAPFKFYTDAILGLCYHKMTDYRNLSTEHRHFSEKAYRSFDPYTELFHKSAPRVRAMRKKDLTHNLHFENFEKQMSEVWDQAFEKNVLCLNKLAPALEILNEFEKQVGAPLIYNLSVHFSEKFTEKLICFYSLLFHLRSVIAVDHNAHVEDSSYESVTCDSISDYLPKADYTVNDALIYWHFKKASAAFTGHKAGDHQVEKTLVEPMFQHFRHYSHNAVNLIENLPASFLGHLNHAEQDEALHLVQMDWLLGSESGLLFKIREELFGVIEGYDRIFWPACAEAKTKKSSSLNLCFELAEKDLAKDSAVA